MTLVRALHRIPAVVLFVLAALVSSGCGSSSSGNGVASKTPTEIVAATRAAGENASSVHVSGSIVSASAPITLDMDLVRGKGGRGQLSEGGLSFELIETEGTVYIKGSPTFYSHFAGSAAAQLFQGKWLKAPAGSSNFASLTSLIELRQLLGSALASHGKLVKSASTTAEGQQAVGVTDTSQGATLYVARTGEPYPIEIVKGGASGGKIRFSHWNEPVSLTAPANAVDITKLQAGQ
jgi:hypothetical protein